jgi:hypothetical protein
MSGRLGILFLHHHIDPVVKNNLRSIQSHNPDACLASISAGEPLPGGYTLQATPRLKPAHSAQQNSSSDVLVCSWYLQRRPQDICDKWWIVEWDVFCGMSARDYYRPVWDFPFVVSSARLPHREPEWYWFNLANEGAKKEPQKIPEGYKPFVVGMVPFLCLVSEAALKATCAMLLENPLRAANGELRFATAANRCGYPPCGFSPPNDQISWQNWKTLPPNPAIVHPVKHLVEF